VFKHLVALTAAASASIVAFSRQHEAGSVIGNTVSGTSL